MVLLVIGLVIGTTLAVHLSSGRAETITAREQEFLERRMSLMMRLKRDLRSGAGIREPASGQYVIQVLVSGPAGVPTTEEVWYRRSENGKIVRRFSGKKVDTYDFTEFLGDTPLVFRIENLR